MGASPVGLRSAATPRFAGDDYTMQRGVTLPGIAARNGASLAALEAARRRIGNPNLVRRWGLRVPGT